MDRSDPGLGFPKGAAAKVALLVGIDDYQAGGEGGAFHALQGCVRDVQRFRSTLSSRRFGFKPEDIVVLTNEHATHANIVRAFDQALVRRATPTTEAVFFFAGHGSRLPDAYPNRSGELDGHDSTLVAYDSRRKGQAPFDITDDELHSLLAALCERTKRVTVITDACHSGGVTRGSDDATRTAPIGEVALDFRRVESFWPMGVPILDDKDPRRVKLPYVHVAACLKSQSAAEDWFEDLDGNRYRSGLLTWYLCEELERIEDGATYEQLIQRVARRFATRSSAAFQDPAYEGPVTRKIFGGGFGPPVRGFEVRVRDATGKPAVSVRAGSMHGVNDGAVLAVHTDAGERVGDLRLRDVRLHRSSGEWLKSPPALEAISEANLRGTVSSLGEKAAPLLVHLPAGEFEDKLAPILEQATNPHLRVLRDANATWQYALHRDVTGAMRLWAGDSEALGEAIPTSGGAKEAAHSILENLEREWVYLNWMRLAEQRGNVQVELSIEPLPTSELAKYDSAGSIRPAQFEEQRPRSSKYGTPVVLDRPGVIDAAKVVVRIPRKLTTDMYLWIFSLMENRRRNLIYPDKGGARSGENLLTPGAEPDLPDIELLLPRPGEGEWKADRPMRDRYIVLLTTSRIGLAGLVAEGEKVESVERSASKLRGVLSRSSTTRGQAAAPLPKVLEVLLSGAATRGRPLRGAATTTFGVASFDVFVKREGER